MWPDNLKVRILRSSWKRMAAGPRLAIIGGAIALVCVPVAALLAMRSPDSAPTLQVPQEIARLDIKELRKQEAALQTRIRKLAEKENRLFPNGPAILIDTAANQISLLQDGKLVAQDKCSTGSGLELTDTSGNRTWTFETPRGYFRVLSKVSNPVWYRPDWAFVEEGSPIPKDRASRAVADVLGDYAIAFGDGYFIHGTLYTRMLGSSVTHGCIRVDDDILKKLYQSAQPGTPIWIY